MPTDISLGTSNPCPPMFTNLLWKEICVGSWVEIENKIKTYRSRLRIPAFSSSSVFNLYLSHSGMTLSSKPPKVMNVTTISGRSWTALQARPQSGRTDPVDQLDIILCHFEVQRTNPRPELPIKLDAPSASGPGLG